MALIDLKNVNLYLRDGFDNGAASPTSTDIEPIGETTIALTACTVAVPVGAGVVFGSHTTEYTVASRTIPGGTAAVQTLTSTTNPTGGTFTLTYDGETTETIEKDALPAAVELALEALDSIPNGTCTVTASVTDYTDGDLIFTFSAPLEGAIADMVLDATSLTGGSVYVISTTTPGVLGTTTTVIVLNEVLVAATTAAGAITFKGIKLEIGVGEGNLEYTSKTPREFKLNRGNLSSVKNADQEPMDVSFGFEWDYIRIATGIVPTIEQVFERTGPAADWTTTASDSCDPFCVNIEIHNAPTCTGGGSNTTEDITLARFYPEELQHSIEDSTINCTGRCNSVISTSVRY